MIWVDAGRVCHHHKNGRPCQRRRCPQCCGCHKESHRLPWCWWALLPDCSFAYQHTFWSHHQSVHCAIWYAESHRFLCFVCLMRAARLLICLLACCWSHCQSVDCAVWWAVEINVRGCLSLSWHASDFLARTCSVLFCQIVVLPKCSGNASSAKWRPTVGHVWCIYFCQPWISSCST